MIEPHGGSLVNKELPEVERKRVLEQFDEFEKITVTPQIWKVIKNISYGVFSPLEGFMHENDTLNVLEHMCLESNEIWPFPIVLDVSEEEVKDIKPDDRILLVNAAEKPLAMLIVNDIYDYDKKNYAKNVYGTTDTTHPGVNKVFNMKEKLLGGEIFLVEHEPAVFPDLDLKPLETRVLFKTKNWDRVAAFQTRNPPHLGHEYVQKAALTVSDGLFINPVMGKKKKGDFKDQVIIEAYKTLIDNYYPENRVVLSTFETEMRYAGPKEALFHAIARKNFGCDRIIIGRDHAGVGDFYGPYDAHKIFDQFPDLGIEPITFRSFSRCTVCNSVVNDKICPHPPEKHVFFSGSNIRKLIRECKKPTPDIMRPEVADIILKYQEPFC
ncbi:MAG: sulfate adenylyltransferase [Promethearchaeia archaeon]